MIKSPKLILRRDTAGGLLLIFATIIAMFLANSSLESHYTSFLSIPVKIQLDEFYIHKPLLLWINDGLMALFFFLVGMEVKREMLQGNLKSLDQIVLPGVAAVAGIAVPALIFLLVNRSYPGNIQGWAIPAATDIAFALGVYGLFGRFLPLSLKLFLLSLAIFDDIGAIVIIAVFYSHDLATTPLLIAAVGLVCLFLLNRFSVRFFPAYVVLGLIVWAAVLKSGIHATLAGFLVAWFIPIQAKTIFETPLLESVEHSLRPWVTFLILPLFAFANAGVSVEGISASQLIEPITIGVAMGLFIGKQAGILGISWAVIKLGLAKLPKDSTWLQFYGVTLLCGIGFTMSLFIGNLTFTGTDPGTLEKVKIGVLTGSLLSAVAGAIIIRFSDQFRQEEATELLYLK